jgi:hypothetical protein
MLRIVLLIVISLLSGPINNSLFSQEKLEELTKAELLNEEKNEIGIFVGTTYIFDSGFILPTFGIEYLHELTPSLAIGFISEIELGSHIISMNEELHEMSEVERKSAILVLPVLYYQIGKFGLYSGYGIEFEQEENLGLFKLGASYILHLKNEEWAIVPNVSWDHTKLFDAFVYGFTLGKKF